MPYALASRITYLIIDVSYDIFLELIIKITKEVNLYEWFIT